MRPARAPLGPGLLSQQAGLRAVRLLAARAATPPPGPPRPCGGVVACSPLGSLAPPGLRPVACPPPGYPVRASGRAAPGRVRLFGGPPSAPRSLLALPGAAPPRAPGCGAPGRGARGGGRRLSPPLSGFAAAPGARPAFRRTGRRYGVQGLRRGRCPLRGRMATPSTPTGDGSV